MESNIGTAGEDRAKSTKAVTASILCILVIFLVVQVFGSPVPSLGSLSASVVFSIVVFIPVAIVCVLALVKSGKMF